MSWAASAWAKKARTGGPATKAVLLCLADYADEENSCYPGQELLAEETEQSVRTIRRHLDTLEELGLITRERRFNTRGHRTSDRFILHVSAKFLHPENPTGQVDPLDDSEREKTPTGQSDLRSTDASLPDNGDNPYRPPVSGEQLEEHPVENTQTDDSLRSSSAHETNEPPQPALIPAPDGPNATSNGKPNVPSAAEEKAARRSQAESIARRWHDKYEADVGPLANWRHTPLRNMIEQALVNYSELEVTRALAALGRPLPAAPAWQDALVAVRNGRPVEGRQITTRHHVDPASPDRAQRVAAFDKTG